VHLASHFHYSRAAGASIRKLKRFFSSSAGNFVRKAETNVETAREVNFVQGVPRLLLIALSFFNEFH
jgi:hypothetical protein